MPASEKKCPFSRKACMTHDCMLYVQVMGSNPNTGAEISEWGCSLAWMPVLQIEGSQQTRQAGAAIESFRNEMVKGNQDFMVAMTDMRRRALGHKNEIEN